jgi:serine/threonine-protein kinase
VLNQRVTDYGYLSCHRRSIAGPLPWGKASGKASARFPELLTKSTLRPARVDERSGSDDNAAVAAGPYYEILGRLGSGGMGEILLARNTTTRELSRNVVLKRMAATDELDDDAVAAFLYEARISFGLSHPNIAQVYDFHEFNGVYYLAIEYIQGLSVLQLLRKAIASKQRVPLPHVLTIAVGVCAGLHYSHTQPREIIHRDITPSNIMVSVHGGVKIIDFGIAKPTLDTDLPQGATRKGLVKGKAGYIAPERIVGNAVDRRCDVFSLGVVLWEMLAGRTLFQKPSEIDTLEATLHTAAPRVSRFRPGLPASVEAVVMRALNKYPSQRFDSAANMLMALESAAQASHIALSNWNLGVYLQQLCRDAVDDTVPTGTEKFPARGTDTDGYLLDEEAPTPVRDVEPRAALRDAATQLIPFAQPANRRDDQLS